MSAKTVFWDGKDLASIQELTFSLPRVHGRPAAEVDAEGNLKVQGAPVLVGQYVTVFDDGTVKVGLLKLPNVMKDPRYLEACKFFDMWDWGWGIPSDPHARENLRHATGRLAADDDPDEKFLDLVVKRYLGDKYQERARTEAKRIARNAARAVAAEAEAASGATP